ncbi:MAG: glucose-6-phosphate dehydrogenase [Pirellulales bacterium]
MPHTIVIFGASGDLTHRKLVPALYRLFCKGRLPRDTRVVGFARTPFTHDAWRADLKKTLAANLGPAFDAAAWDRFAPAVFYHPGDIEKSDDFAGLSQLLTKTEPAGGVTRLYYLAMAPQFYEPAVVQLGRSGLADETGGPRRVIIEKPFGIDLGSARRLNEVVHSVFRERQVYRIDHYLGKETVQNLLVLRFANSIFEPLWNRNYIDHVQITVAEEVDVGSRGAYYDTAGVVRDMFQNHLLQLLMITAMEAPARYAADAIRDEKVKVLHCVRPLSGEQVGSDTLRGQYLGYTKAEGAKPDSRTATFAAIKLWVDNWRWQGVPFYLRSGKAMSCRTTQIVVQYRKPPHMIFSDGPKSDIDANRLIVQVQPAEGIQLHFETKVPDAGMKLRQTDLDFRYQREFRGAIPEAYERLLLDALEGDASLFARADEVEAAWAICDPIIEHWQRGNDPPLHEYEPSCWGPVESIDWMAKQQRQWFDTCPVLH